MPTLPEEEAATPQPPKQSPQAPPDVNNEGENWGSDDEDKGIDNEGEDWGS
eukprot:CAMPEP_0172570964 /NCGR_PEP_ID=MMETSP1067-20121228/129563_1 /TAXON_ID=265564 ORGANISM="Thalassiosira punctigera, Strain Tpunct2005C2" /NCGR_SAMPLE_ID=MMETSP1067 /ASSEMBLY_ACC=CAM_ASM_000444 /LENGTH=50 /DNA_ID=CAMNT_0013363177 /DNA_START=111 /DNA_END=260 /DNA_ORIENTATION=+